MKCNKVVLAAMMLCMCGSIVRAQISVEEAERKLAEKQSAKPTTKPVMIRPVAAATTPNMDLLAQSLVELKAGNFKESIETSKAFQATLRNPIGKLNDPNWIDSLHIQAVAHMRLGQFARAGDVLERAYMSGMMNRSLLVNHAIIDISLKNAAMRAVKDLKAYNATHPDDELIINLWGAALDVAASKNQAKNIDDEADDYLKANAALEKAKPGGMKHWGTQWISAGDYAKIEFQRKSAMNDVEFQSKILARKEDELASAKERYNRANTLTANFGRPLTTDRRGFVYTEQERRRIYDERDRRELNNAQQAVNDAQRAVDRAAEAVATARGKLPRPDWSMKLEPVDPEPIVGSSKGAVDVGALKYPDWEKQQAALPAQTRAFEIKGARLGMPLEVFKTKFQRAGSGEPHPAPFTSDENPQKDNPALLYKAAFGKAGIVTASIAAPEDVNQESPNRPTIAGAPATSFVYHFVDGKLYQMTIAFDRGNFQAVSEALKNKFGAATGSQFKKYDSNTGDRFDGQASIWSNSVSEINLYEFAGAGNRSLLIIVQKDLQKAAADRLKETGNGKVNDL
jgi:tetratricopeptide (TPR) repeat protein